MMGGDVNGDERARQGLGLYRPLAGQRGPAGKEASWLGRQPSISADCVLVIDDDATARELISDHLKADGFSVVAAAGGVEALKLAKERRPIAITPRRDDAGS